MKIKSLIIAILFFIIISAIFFSCNPYPVKVSSPTHIQRDFNRVYNWLTFDVLTRDLSDDDTTIDTENGTKCFIYKSGLTTDERLYFPNEYYNPSGIYGNSEITYSSQYPDNIADGSDSNYQPGTIMFDDLITPGYHKTVTITVHIKVYGHYYLGVGFVIPDQTTDYYYINESYKTFDFILYNDTTDDESSDA